MIALAHQLIEVCAEWIFITGPVIIILPYATFFGLAWIEHIRHPLEIEPVSQKQSTSRTAFFSSYNSQIHVKRSICREFMMKVTRIHGIM